MRLIAALIYLAAESRDVLPGIYCALCSALVGQIWARVRRIREIGPGERAREARGRNWFGSGPDGYLSAVIFA